MQYERREKDAVVQANINRPRIRHAHLAQDGHSHAEQSVYIALWDAGQPDADGNRITTMGLGRLARRARLAESNARVNTRSLIAKLSIKQIAPEDSRTGIGKTYRVYSYKNILKRRKDAGMEWVVRTKGVKFVEPDGRVLAPRNGLTYTVQGEGPAVAAPGTGAQAIEGDATNSGAADVNANLDRDRDSAGAAFGSARVPDDVLHVSAAEVVVVAKKLGSIGIDTDDGAAREILERCKAVDSSATTDEICFCMQLKVVQLRKNPKVRNWPGMLINAVPQYFQEPATALKDYRAKR